MGIGEESGILDDVVRGGLAAQPGSGCWVGGIWCAPWNGVVDTMQVDKVPLVDRLIDRVLWLVRRLEIDPAVLKSGILSPACGLAGWSRHDAAEVCRTVKRAGDLVDEQLDQASR